ncbi:hypothetical protein DPMN_133047 [Dreissena polymorpha]|uniref:Uncharacterized protein n=1 Tax=Dreissena polymorpha TaxID=45954 RepID=A0A9D4FSS5_DREPO|nr:hypothetical protein DPMN_133047 [Dreissena polymorpha]
MARVPIYIERYTERDRRGMRIITLAFKVYTLGSHATCVQGIHTRKSRHLCAAGIHTRKSRHRCVSLCRYLKRSPVQFLAGALEISEMLQVFPTQLEIYWYETQGPTDYDPAHPQPGQVHYEAFTAMVNVISTIEKLLCFYPHCGSVHYAYTNDTKYWFHPGPITPCIVEVRRCFRAKGPSLRV